MLSAQLALSAANGVNFSKDNNPTEKVLQKSSYIKHFCENVREIS
jgi:hypothetical protein